MRKITKRSAAVIGATVIAIGGGAAWAATSWFSGSGTSTVSAASATPITAQATVVGGKLWPGVKRNATISVTNPNEYPVKITDAAATSINISSGDGACTLANSKITLGNVPNGVVVAGKPANANATPIDAGTFPEFVQMGADASPVCAGATITVNFSLTGAVA